MRLFFWELGSYFLELFAPLADAGGLTTQNPDPSLDIPTAETTSLTRTQETASNSLNMSKISMIFLSGK